MTDNVIEPRKWYFDCESAIYERIGFDRAIDYPNLPGDNTMRLWKDEKVYRYFWHWELPGVTYTHHFANLSPVGFPVHQPAFWCDKASSFYPVLVAA